MSIITLPRGRHVERPITRPTARPHRAPQHQATTRRHRTNVFGRLSAGRRAAAIVVLSMAMVVVSNMYLSQRQVELHNLQSQLMQEQSTYAQQLGTATNYSAPGYVATQAGTLHLASPISVTQVPSASLDTPLPLPKFVGPAPVVPRTQR
jgi:hypothetical protein